MGNVEGLDAVPTRPVGDVDVAAAQRTAARYATGVDDLALLLDMLGIGGRRAVKPVLAPVRTPMPAVQTRNTGTCAACGRACGSKKDETWKGPYYGARGLCERCYAADRRKRAKAATA